MRREEGVPFWALGRDMRWSFTLTSLLLIACIRLSADIAPIIELSKDDSAKAQALRSPLYSADFHFLIGAGDRLR